jgi:hypothetical protein
MNRIKLTTCLLSISLLAQISLAEEAMDIDQSNTLDFEAFHTSKKNSIKLYDSKTGGIFGGGKQEAQKSVQADNSEHPIQSAGSANIKENTGEQNKHYEIRELYAITRSERTGLNPTTVVQALHLQMQGFCPEGWRKLDERTEVDGEDAFYMYYVFECL